jgi:hypothetical protein
MARPKVTNAYASSDYYFANFTDLQDFNTQGKEIFDAREARGASNYRPLNPRMDFEGSTNVTELNEATFNYTYIDKPLLDNTMDSFDSLMAKIDMGGAFEKSRLKVTDDMRGIFDFSLASKGLFRKKEFFSQEFADFQNANFIYVYPDLPPGVVPNIDVDKDRFDNYWYTYEDGTKYQMTQQDKGQAAMDNGDPNAKYEYGTSTKKSYLMFERKRGKAKMVDLYVGVGGLEGLTYEGMLARAMPLILAARYFEMSGIKTRINAARMYYNGSKNVCFTYTIKNYGNDLNFNAIAMSVADPRWFRWNLWKYTAAYIREKLGDSSSTGYGSTIYGGERLYETFNRYKNWYFEQMDAGLQPKLQINPNLMLIGGLEAPGNSLSLQQDDIKKEFFRILDIVDFQFNRPEKAAQRIYKRMVLDDGESVDRYKQYVNRTLSTAYSYPSSGQYATPPKRQDELDKEFETALEGMQVYLDTIQ